MLYNISSKSDEGMQEIGILTGTGLKSDLFWIEMPSKLYCIKNMSNAIFVCFSYFPIFP